MNQLSKKELVLIYESLVAYYKIRKLEFLPIYERYEIRENMSNYLDIMNNIDDLIDKIENFIENLDESENS